MPKLGIICLGAIAISALRAFRDTDTTSIAYSFFFACEKIEYMACKSRQTIERIY